MEPISRTPSETDTGRMQPLARLPVFLALDGKRALVAGGNQAATWKAELLSAAGARVDVYAAEMSTEMRHLAANPPRAARAYALLAVGSSDAFLANQDSKFTYWIQRPAQADTSMVPLFPAPNFPSFFTSRWSRSPARGHS